MGSGARALVLLLVAAAGGVIGFSLAVLTGKRAPAVADAAVAAPRGTIVVEKLSIGAGLDHWVKGGFVEMTPPVRLPTDTVESDVIRVFLRIPGDDKIIVRDLGARKTLRFPPGTVADRVESFGDAVIDVRGTVIAEDGQLFHVLVPTGASATSPLVGWEWLRNDDEAQRAATSLLARQLSTTTTLQDVRGADKRALIAQYEKNNACAACHVADKPLELDARRAMHRATDDDGFFVPLTVLQDAVPIETHRPRDMNADDPFIALECSGGLAPQKLEDDSGARRLRCQDGTTPLGVLDVKGALAHDDAHAKAVCASRKYLWDHMDSDGRRAFADAFAACGI